jgi:hypothetical protein
VNYTSDWRYLQGNVHGQFIWGSDGVEEWIVRPTAGPIPFPVVRSYLPLLVDTTQTLHRSPTSKIHPPALLVDVISARSLCLGAVERQEFWQLLPAWGWGFEVVAHPLRRTAATELDHPFLHQMESLTVVPRVSAAEFPTSPRAHYRVLGVAGGEACFCSPTACSPTAWVYCATRYPPRLGGLVDGISDAHSYTLEWSPRSRGCPGNNAVATPATQSWQIIIVLLQHGCTAPRATLPA